MNKSYNGYDSDNKKNFMEQGAPVDLPAAATSTETKSWIKV